MEWTLTVTSSTSSSPESGSSDFSEVFPEEIFEGEEHDEEEETEFEGSKKEIVSSFINPFTFNWVYGRNIQVPFLNLTSENHKRIFYSAANVGIFYNYKDKTMNFLRGHKNCITSIASDSFGKWIVTADAGNDNIIIVWNSETGLPTRTIFNPHGCDGTKLIGMSPDATYLVSVSNSKDQVVACWKWTLGGKTPNDKYTLDSQYGKIHQIVFCEQKTGDFMLTTEFCVLFGIWANNTLTVYMQERPKRFGELCCSVYQNYSHYALTTTDNGNLLMWSDVPFSSVYNCEVVCSNNKTLLKTLNLDKESIPVIKTHQELIITGSVTGGLRFYDKMIKILYWVQSFHLSPITGINFHRWYEDADKKQKDGSCTIINGADSLKPLYTLEKAFEKVLEKEKEKLEEIKSLLKDVKKSEKEVEGHPEEVLIEDIVSNVLAEVRQWDLNETLGDKRKFIEKIVKTSIDYVESKLSSALAHTEDLIEGFVNSVLEEVDEDIPKGHGKDVAHSVMNEIVQPFHHQVVDNEDDEIIVRDVLEDMIDAVGIVDDIMDSENVGDDVKQLTEVVITNVFQVIEEKFAIDTQKIVELIVKNLVEYFDKELESEGEKEIENIEPETDKENGYKLYGRLKKILNQDVDEKSDYQVPSDATLERQPFVLGDFMISTSDGDIGLVNFLNNSYTTVLDKCVSPITALDCHPEKQQFAVGNATGSVILYNFLHSQNKVLESLVNSKEEKHGVTALKFAPSGFYLACGMTDGSFWILDSSILTPLLKSTHVHVDAPITQICISDDSQWIAHKDEKMRVCLYRYEDSGDSELEFMGKQRSHFKPIRDLMFMRSLEGELHLFSLGEDHMLVEYDLTNSDVDDLKILLVERIEQSAIPYCMTEYPKFGVENFILIANNEYKFKIFNSESRMCRKTALGPTFEKPVSKCMILPKRNEKSQYMVYACEKYIGIQMIPLDGNPYKTTGIIGHPVKVTHMNVHPSSKILFTVGQDDHAVFLWTIHTRAINTRAHFGGEGLDPYYSLIDGGQNGCLYKEIEDFFYYAQILHEGENTTCERNVSHEIPLCELPDLMRAIGYFPSEHEIGNMLHEIQFWTYSDNGKLQKYILFEDFVKLYLNHRPAFGIPFSKLREAFEYFADDDDDETGDPIVYRETLTSILQERAECLSQEQVIKYMQVLYPSTQEPDESSSSSGSASEGSLLSFIPEEITYKLFVEDILGMNFPDTEKDAEQKTKQEKDEKESVEEIEDEISEDEEQAEEEDECPDDFD